MFIAVLFRRAEIGNNPYLKICKWLNLKIAHLNQWTMSGH